MGLWCRGCQCSGWLLKLDNNGLCERCSPVMLPDILNHCRIVIESGDIVRSSKNVMTQLSRCEVAIKHCNKLLPYEQRGIPTLTMAPSEAIPMFANKREKLIDELIHQVCFDARQKATDAPTDAGKLGGYAKAIHTLDKAMAEVQDVTKLEAAMLELRGERDNLNQQLSEKRAQSSNRKRAGMGIFSFFKPDPAIGGDIAYFGLQDWWLSMFTEDERTHMVRTYQPLGSSGDSLISGQTSFTTQTAVSLLSGMAGWFTREADRSIADRLLRKAQELSASEAGGLGSHFMYHTQIEVYYRDRDKPGYLEKAIEACRQQIAIAPQALKEFKAEYGDFVPSHKGYNQLAIILEKQKRFDECIALCEQAAQQGWTGDWYGRIERCRKRMVKAQVNSAA